MDTESCVAIRDLVEHVTTTKNPSIFSAGSHRQHLDSISFETYLREAKVTDKAFATAQVWTHAMLGVDPAEVSALYFLECKSVVQTLVAYSFIRPFSKPT